MQINEHLQPDELLIGHGWAASLLQRAIDTGKTTHAYVFSGPAGIGKSYLALQFTMALCCLEPPAQNAEEAGLRFCGKCRACRLIWDDKHPDVTTVGLDWQARNADITGTSNANLKIDTVRAVQQEISRAPSEAPWRIFVIEDAATMQPAAANAFLKTLEEPPARAMLILIADSDKALLPTIVSRCQVFELRSVPILEIVEALQLQGATLEQAQILAALSAGRPGYALQALQNKNFKDDRDEALHYHSEQLAADRVGRLNFAEELNQRWLSQGDKRASVLVMLNVWLGWWRDLALVHNGLESYATNQDQLDELRKQARKLNLVQIKNMLQGITRVSAELDSNVSPRLAFGDLFVNKLPRF